MGRVVVLGVFNADTTYRADRLPNLGETIMGNAFSLGPGGKGSNQAVAAARAGAETHMLTRLGRDTFADLAAEVWRDAGVTSAAIHMDDQPTGAAFIYVEEGSGDNCIIVCPGAGGMVSAADMEARADLIRGSDVFLAQLEQPVEAAHRGLQIAREAGVATILNPAPATALPDGMLALCDYVTPNESEAETLTGIGVAEPADAETAARALLDQGVGWAAITLGQNGVFLTDGRRSETVPARAAGPVVETTGAGDAFNGGFAAALSDGADPIEAAKFGVAVAGLSVTRAGAAASMPTLAEIEAFLAEG